MSKKKKLIPELRFPVFLNSKEWETEIFKNVFDRLTSKNEENNQNVLTISAQLGLVSQLDYFNKKVAAKDVTGYYLLHKGDFAYNKSYSKGYPMGAIKPLKFYDKGVVSTLYICFRAKDENTVTFFEHYFEAGLLNSEISKIAQEGGRAHGLLNVGITDFFNTRLLIPKPKEQQRIADCLTSIDELINAHIDKLEALKNHKKGLMQNLFPKEGQKVPKVRFPEFKKDEDWKEIKLINTADKNVKWSFTGGPFGSNLKASDYTVSGFRIIQLQNIGDGEFNDEYKIYTSEEKADDLLSCNIYAGDIILSKMGDPVGRACIIPNHLKRCVMASDGIRLVVDDKKFSKYFIYSLINSKPIREAIERKSTGSTRKRIGLNDLKEVELIIPKNPKEQEKIASCLSALDELINKQKEKIEQLQQHKTGLIQGMFPKIES